MSDHMETKNDVFEDARPGVKKDVLPVNYSSIDTLPEPKMPTMPQVEYGMMPLEWMFDVPITMVFEVGRIDITVKELMELREGSMIDLRQVSVDSIDIRINGYIVAYGEAIGLKQQYGIRVGDLETFSALDDVGGDDRRARKAGG